MRRERATAALAALVVGPLALAGCAWIGDVGSNKYTCPNVGQAPGADKIPLFGPAGHASKDVVVGGRIYDISTNCERDKVGLVIDAKITFVADRASAATKDATLPYFVALVDPQQRVLTEESFQITVQFVGGEAERRMPPEDITVHLPVKDPTVGNAYYVIVGFQLTPDQIAFNRSAQGQ
jgi:hypothetical protein